MKAKLIIALLLQCVSVYSWAYEFPNMFERSGKTANNTYAIVIVGGDQEARHMWEGAKSYQFLTKFMGVPKANIAVCIGDNSSHDLDCDNGNDVRFASSMAGIRAAFAEINSKATANDEFIFSAVDHGGNNTFSLFTGSLYSSELATLINNLKCEKVNIWLHACHSGSFIDELKGYNKNTTIITSTSAAHSSWSRNNKGSHFFEPFYAALAGHYKINVNSNSIVASDNEADYNGDGEVSYEEAFVFAKDRDIASKPKSTSNMDEIPRYWSSETPWRFCRDTDWGIVNSTGTISNTNKDVEAMYLLNGSCIIKDHSDVYFSSGNRICLRSGFQVKNGSNFSAQLFDCEAEKLANEAELRKAEVKEQIERIDIFTLSPNPTTGRFSVDMGVQPGTIKVFDTQGRLISSVNATEGVVDCDITDMPAGVYIVEIKTLDYAINKKVVKQ